MALADDVMFKLPKELRTLPMSGEFGVTGPGMQGFATTGMPNFIPTAPAAPALTPGSSSLTAIPPTPAGGGGFGQPNQPAPPGLSLMDESTRWNATTGAVGDDERVAEQLRKLLASDSPYVDQARQGAYARANERGLLNSSLAAGAGEEAAIAQALPIAQQDASTYSKQNLTNQAALNAAGSQNAQVGFNTRQLGEQARQFDNDSSLKAKSLLEQARQFDVGVSVEDKKMAEQARQFDNDQLSKLSMFNRDTASHEQIAQLDASTKQYLANTEAQYKTLMQSSASAAQLWQTYQQEVSRILGNKDLDQPNKQAALTLLQNNLKEGMNLIGYMGSLDLGGLLNFPGAGGGAQLPPSNTAPGAPGAGPAPGPGAGPAPPGGVPPAAQPLPPTTPTGGPQYVWEYDRNRNPGRDYYWAPGDYPGGSGGAWLRLDQGGGSSGDGGA